MELARSRRKSDHYIPEAYDGISSYSYHTTIWRKYELAKQEVRYFSIYNKLGSSNRTNAINAYKSCNQTNNNRSKSMMHLNQKDPKQSASSELLTPKIHLCRIIPESTEMAKISITSSRRTYQYLRRMQKIFDRIALQTEQERRAINSHNFFSCWCTPHINPSNAASNRVCFLFQPKSRVEARVSIVALQPEDQLQQKNRAIRLPEGVVSLSWCSSWRFVPRHQQRWWVQPKPNHHRNG